MIFFEFWSHQGWQNRKFFLKKPKKFQIFKMVQNTWKSYYFWFLMIFFEFWSHQGWQNRKFFLKKPKKFQIFKMVQNTWKSYYFWFLMIFFEFWSHQLNLFTIWIYMNRIELSELKPFENLILPFRNPLCVNSKDTIYFIKNLLLIIVVTLINFQEPFV